MHAMRCEDLLHSEKPEHKLWIKAQVKYWRPGRGLNSVVIFLSLHSFKIYLLDKNVLGDFILQPFWPTSLVFYFVSQMLLLISHFIRPRFFFSPRDIWQSNSFPSNPSNIVKHHGGGHVQTMALNHLFWSEKSHTGLHLVPCSSWHHLKHAILLSSILCVTFQVPPVAQQKRNFHWHVL